MNVPQLFNYIYDFYILFVGIPRVRVIYIDIPICLTMGLVLGFSEDLKPMDGDLYLRLVKITSV